MKRHLQHIHIERYGGLADRAVGPFAPGLNVVVGPNEAGKSTLASFVGGVLFGWEDARGVRNRYVPAEGGRAGRLDWSEGFLARDEDGVSGDESTVADLDRATYEAMFAFSADELRALRGSSDVAAQLLAAGSGTAASPSSAFVEIERRIANTKVYELENALEQKRAHVKEAAARAELLIQEDAELRELAASRANTAHRIDALNAEIEELISVKAELDSIDDRTGRLTRELEDARAERSALEATSTAVPDAAGGQPAGQLVGLPAGQGTSQKTSLAVDESLLVMDAAEDRALRDRLDDLADKKGKLERALDLAKENSATSSAAYEALCELDDGELEASRSLRHRPWQAAVSILLPIAFVVAGVPLFVHGREINSLSITALGIGLIVVAVFLAAAAFFVLFRQPDGTEGLEGRRQDAQWVMLQDSKKFDACSAELVEFSDELSAFMASVGLGAADGSIRQARSLLDAARELREERAESAQKMAALDARISLAERELRELEASRAALMQGDVEPGTAIKQKTAQRDALLEAVGDMGERFGELSRELDLARDDHSFDRLKLEYEQIRAQLREEKRGLIVALLARRMLERSIATWERQSQPEVYERAGRLLATITDGRWTGVSTSATGSLVAVSPDGVARDPRHLSLGTCQQLYLALRIALLLTAQDVGRAIPVLADDILVNFDAARRRGAAQALSELAQKRQVIVFTCHAETAAILQEYGASTLQL